MGIGMKHGIASIGEQRLTALKISENFKALGRDTLGTYVQGPVKSGNYAQAALGVPAGILRTAFEAPDALLEGALDRRLDLATHNRVIRDVSIIGGDTAAAVGNLLTLRWGKALKNVGGVALAALRTPQSVIMEVVDQGGGFDSYRSGVHAEAARIMSHENN